MNLRELGIFLHTESYLLINPSDYVIILQLVRNDNMHIPIHNYKLSYFCPGINIVATMATTYFAFLFPFGLSFSFFSFLFLGLVLHLHSY